MSAFRELSRQLNRHRAARVDALVVVRSTGSTNGLARRIFDEYSNDGHATPTADVVAWSQDAGRGREGRSWSSPAGKGIYVTALRRVESAGRLQLLSVAVGVALCETLNLHSAGACRLKWPNDLYCRGRKIGGILIDTKAEGEGKLAAMIGFGINYSAELAAFAVGRATSCEEEARALGVEAELPPMARLTIELLEALDRRLEETPEAGLWLETYRRLSLHREGETLCCRAGSEWLEGRFLGFDPSGLLRLEVGGRERRLAAAELPEPQ